jgi:SIR2-like domain
VSLRDELSAHLNGFRSAPFLFIGAGLSRRYLGLESWEGLLRRYAAETSRPYEYYVATANGVLPAVASAIARELHERWWSSDRYKDSRELFAPAAIRQDSALKIEVARYLASSIERLPINGPLAAEIDKLRGIVVDGIITTNYDPLLEKLFPDLRVFVGQDELLFSDPQGVGEIYKIHGSYAVPNSLVLTSEDYDRFRERNPYLAAKLLTIFVEHPVMFIGYSLADPTITEILVSIASCLTTENIAKLQDQLLFIQWDPNATAPTLTRTAIMASGFVIPVVTANVTDFNDVFGALAGLHRKFPVRLLRQLKQHVYKLVLEKEPKGTLYVQDLEANADVNEVEVVIGVGIMDRIHQRGYRGLSRWDLADDLLNDDGNFDPESVVRQALPRILRQAQNVPVYKYLRGAGYLDDNGELKRQDELDTRVQSAVRTVRSRLMPSAYHRRAAETVLPLVHSLDELLVHGGVHNVLFYATLLPSEQLDSGELRAFLRDQRPKLNRYNSAYVVQYFKLICLYDWRTYGNSNERFNQSDDR